MPWWLWILIAFGLLTAEMLVPSGFFLLLFGIAFMITGGLVAVGLNDPAWLPWIICSVIATVLVFLLRKPLMRLFNLDGPSSFNEIHSEEVTIKSTINPSETGQGELRGTVWKVRNIGTTVLRPGDRCRVERIDGLTVETKS